MRLKQPDIKRILILLILIGSVVRVLDVFMFNPMDHLFSDPERHWKNAAFWLKPNLMGGSDPIIYQVYLFLVRVVSGDNRYVIASVCAMLSIVMPWVYFRVACEMNFGDIPSLLVWLLIVWCPSLLSIYHYFMMETLLLLLVGLSMWASVRSLKCKTTYSFLIAVSLWTLASLTKMSVLPAAALCLWYCWWKLGRPIKYILPAVSMALILIIPSAVRSYNILGFTAPFGNPWLVKSYYYSEKKNIIIEWENQKFFFSSPSCYTQPLEPLSRWMLTRTKTDSSLNVRLKKSEGVNGWKNIYDGFQMPLSKILHLSFENQVFLLFGPSWPESTHNEFMGWLVYISRWVWAPIILFVLIGNLWSFSERDFALIAVVTTVMIMALAFQNTTIMEGRYRKPLEPLLLMNVVWLLRPKSKHYKTES